METEFNITLNQITPACFEWCSEQHYSNDFQSITIVVVATILLSVYMCFKSWKSSLEDVAINHFKVSEWEDIKKIIEKIPEFSFYLLIGFLIYFVWFT